MSVVYNILEQLVKIEIRYKGGCSFSLLKLVQFGASNKKTMRTSFYRLSQQGLIEKGVTGWKVSVKGKRYLQNPRDSFKSFSSPFKNNSPRNLIVSFDIPEDRKVARDWLRIHLKKFDYKMIQRSLWVGPSPLPKEFLIYLKSIKLKNSIKTFKLSKPYKIK